MAAFLASYSLRRGLGPEWWFTAPEASLIVRWGVIYGGIAGLYEALLRNERSAWSYASIADAARLVQATGLTALTFLALIFISNRGITLPRSTLLLAWMLSLFALVGVRVAWRLRMERSIRSVLLGVRPKPRRSGKALLIVGDPRLAAAYLRRHAADSESPYEPVGIVSHDRRLVGQAIHGVRVICCYDQLEMMLKAAAFQPPEETAVLFLEDPISELGMEADLIGRLRRSRRPLLRQPNLSELADRGEALREIGLEEFLRREPVNLAASPIQQLISGKRVLVTGAGGSIGSEICRQLVTLGCSHISLVDHSEFLLFEIDRDLHRISSSISKRAFLCDVRDAERLNQIFEEERPEIVFHAAALKHVTLVELNPCEAVLTNVLGTWNVSAAARRSGASQFVLISTDKAVDPTSFMGATKRVAEATCPESSDALRHCVVRFGNVLGSAGSVVPIFRKQIEQGGPVTVTHPDVERYFMTIPEAVQLVLHAAAISAAGEASRTRKFLLEMGKPVKIYDLARQMIELCGLKPDVDIPIEITGLKPGEKLTEELLDGNESSSPLTVGLAELETRGMTTSLDRSDVEFLARRARSDGPAATRAAVMSYVDRIRGESSPR